MPLPLDEPDPVGIHRYQLIVLASSMADVLRSAGGWICDRARAGWDVNVVVAEDHDERPLSILGASAFDGEWSALVKTSINGGGLAISARLLMADERIRADVLKILKRGLTQVTVWGDDWPAEFGRKGDPVVHTLSSAARAFKTHALGAVTESKSSVTDTETLFELGTESFRPLYAV